MSTALLKWPESPEMLFLLGLLHLGDEDVDAAEEQLAKLSAITKVKDALVFQNKLQQAINDFKRYKQLREYY